MKTFRSKSNFMFGMIFIVTILICEVPMLFSISGSGITNASGYLLLIAPLLVALYMFAAGMQMICIDENGISLSLFGIKLKSLKWQDINEAGTGMIKLGKNKFARQLYVSQRKINDSELKNMDTLRFQPNIIWFDYSLKAQKHLAFHLGMTDSID